MAKKERLNLVGSLRNDFKDNFNSISLTKLHLSRVDMENIPFENLNNLLQVLCTNTTLTYFGIQDVPLGPTSCTALSQFIKCNSTITTLNLSRTQMDDGLPTICSGLHHNSSITKLKLEKNLIGPKSAPALAEALLKNSTLRELHLLGNKITSVGCKSISEALKINSTLTLLDLRSSGIGDDGAKYLSEVLLCNNSLKILNLGASSIGFDGLNCLTKSLSLSSIKKIFLENNLFVQVQDFKPFENVLLKNSSLIEINLKWMKLSKENGKHLVDCLQHNTTLTCIRLDLSIKFQRKVVSCIAKRNKINHLLVGFPGEYQRIPPVLQQMTKLLLLIFYYKLSIPKELATYIILQVLWKQNQLSTIEKINDNPTWRIKYKNKQL